MKNTEVKRLVYKGNFAFNEGVKVGKKETIEKAVAYLNNVLFEVASGVNNIPNVMSVENNTMKEFIDGFLKATEE